MNQCKICKSYTKCKCSNCNKIFYCSVQHQKLDWNAHKNDCYPFKIEKNDEVGRYLTTTRNIKPFEIILKETPLVSGPSQITSPVCLHCLNGIDASNFITCEKCGWPICNYECKRGTEHVAECAFAVKTGYMVNAQNLSNLEPLYQCISTIRCMVLKDINIEKWGKLQELEYLERLRKGSMQWKFDAESIGKLIPRYFKTRDINERDIMRSVGLLQINGHEVPTTDPPHVSIFYLASFLEHSCIPNLAKTFTEDGLLVLWAPKAIKKNSHLSICYSDPLWTTVNRQRHLMHSKLFKCKCPRCIDITELGTNYTAFKCYKNNCTGVLSRAEVNQIGSKWRCSSCNATCNNLYIKKILKNAEKDLQNMGKTIGNCIKYIKYYQRWLPRSHFQINEVKLQLVQLIGKDFNELLETEDSEINLKIEFAKELIELYEKLAPCEVRLLGTLHFELHSAIAEKTRRISLQSQQWPKDLLEESFLNVEKCINYLQHESNLFTEGHILKQAKLNRDALKLVLHL